MIESNEIIDRMRVFLNQNFKSSKVRALLIWHFRCSISVRLYKADNPTVVI